MRPTLVVCAIRSIRSAKQSPPSKYLLYNPDSSSGEIHMSDQVKSLYIIQKIRRAS